LLSVAYDGAGFAGWARQPKGRTVEEILAGAILAVDPAASAPRGTSRTDAGVHAEAQPVAFDAALPIEPRGWVLAINANLPDDVAVRSARAVPAEYAPRFASRGKRYRYRLLLDVVRDPNARARTWRVGWTLDLERMRREGERLVGRHDFAAFRTSSDERKETTRTLTRVSVERESERVVAIVVEGDAASIARVREDARHRGAPVLFLRAPSRAMTELVRAGASDVCSLDAQDEDVCRKVQRLIRRRR